MRVAPSVTAMTPATTPPMIAPIFELGLDGTSVMISCHGFHGNQRTLDSGYSGVLWDLSRDFRRHK